jgi:hypothetical protein
MPKYKINKIPLNEMSIKNHASLQLISNKIQIIRFYLSLVRSVAYGESEVKLFANDDSASSVNNANN